MAQSLQQQMQGQLLAKSLSCIEHQQIPTGFSFPAVATNMGYSGELALDLFSFTSSIYPVLTSNRYLSLEETRNNTVRSRAAEARPLPDDYLHVRTFSGVGNGNGESQG